MMAEYTKPLEKAENRTGEEDISQEEGMRRENLQKETSSAKVRYAPKLSEN